MDEIKTILTKAGKCEKGENCKCLRKRDWAITLWEHLGHFENLEQKLSRYFYVGQIEIAPETGKIHSHIFIQTPSRNTIARHVFDEIFPGGHFEVVRNPADYLAYCQKDDTVMLDENLNPKRFSKGDLKIVGTAGSDHETILDNLWLQMVNGIELNELLRTDPKALRYIEKLERLERRLFGQQLWEQHLLEQERFGLGKKRRS